MTNPKSRIGLSCAVLVLAGFAALPRAQAGFTWSLPAGFPQPRVPADNPMSAEKVALGRRLFYDTRLSANQTQSCASCHQQARAFTDGKAHAIGSTGEVNRRGSMSLANVGHASTLTWADPSQTTLEQQVRIPLFGQHPVELGMPSDGALLVERLGAVPAYRQQFAVAFGAVAPISIDNVARALASFERTIISARSPYDRFRSGRDDRAMSDSAKRGLRLFSNQTLNCARCHKGFTFSGTAEFEGRRQHRPEYFNIGLYNLPGPLSYPATDTGLYELTRDVDDVGKFKVPTLRNIAVTAPYMHDGSIETLGEVLDHYAAGGRTIAGGPTAGNGHDSGGKNSYIKGFALSADQKRDVIAFLESLTDEDFLGDPSLSAPDLAPKP